MYFKILAFTSLVLTCSCKTNSPTEEMVKLITLDPGHFHAALVQKSMYDDIDPNVYVYAPEGSDLQEHIVRIEGYNKRNEDPTHWNEIIYRGTDFFEKMLEERKGNVVVLAGNNMKKTEYIKASLEAGLHVLSDKPMAINTDDFELLRKSFETAAQNGLILYDIMTERSEITTILQKQLSMNKELFGDLEKGSPQNPSITKESVHHFYKYVSGAALKRPAWFFDVEKQGEGIVDVTTHLVDLIQWECFPDRIINYKTDIKIETARRWPTIITPSEFKEVTFMDSFPEYLNKFLVDTLLQVYSNGEINYRINDVCARVSVVWNYKAPEGTGDTHFSMMRGTKANLVIRQGKEQNYKPVLYIEPVHDINREYVEVVDAEINSIQSKYAGVRAELKGNTWEIIIPDLYKIGHEEHFAQVTQRFLQYLKDGKLPEWEVPNMLAKYYTTTKALEIASQTE